MENQNKEQLIKGEKLLKDIIEPLVDGGDMNNVEYEDFVKSLIGKEGEDGIIPSEFPNREEVMPVDKKVQAVLNLGLEDLNMEDEKVPVTEENPVVDNLFPTQSQIGIKDSLGYLAFQLKPKDQKKVIATYLNGAPDCGGRIITANNRFIIDGHHRWSGVYLLNPKSNIPTFNLTIRTGDEEKLLAVMQLAIAATYGGLFMKPADSASDIFNYNGSTEDLIKKVLMGNFGWNQEKEKSPGELRNCLTFLDFLSGKEPNMQEHDDAKGKTEEEVKSMIKDKIENNPEIIQSLIKNADAIKSKEKKSAPQRIAMPQPKDTALETGNEGGDLPDKVRNKLQSGELNFQPKFVGETNKWVKTFEQFRNKK